MKRPTLQTKKRKILGRKVKKLRAKGILPANIYGKGVKSKAVQVDLTNFEKIYQKAGETGIVNLKVKGEKKKRPVLIHNLQLHPVTDQPLHADFHQISLAEKTTVEVPVELVGEAPAEQAGVGVLITLLDSLEVEALPDDLPEKLEVEIAGLKEIDDSVKVSDIQVNRKKVKILADENELVAKIEPPTEEEEVAPPPEEEVLEEAPPEEAKPEEEKPAEKKKKPEEGKEEKKPSKKKSQ